MLQFILWYLIIGLYFYLFLLLAVSRIEDKLRAMDEAENSPIDTANYLKTKGWISIFIYPYIIYKILTEK